MRITKLAANRGLDGDTETLLNRSKNGGSNGRLTPAVRR
jgi:hypothetical protein